MFSWLKPKKSNIDVYFSPGGGCLEAILAQIALAKVEVLLFGYAFTSKSILDALISVKKAGVNVELILDRDSNNYQDYKPNENIVSLIPDIVEKFQCQFSELTHHQETIFKLASDAGLSILLDNKHPIMHNKVLIIDRGVVITGSYNWSMAAERNAENLLVIKDPVIAKKYYGYWQEHKTHSVRIGR